MIFLNAVGYISLIALLALIGLTGYSEIMANKGLNNEELMSVKYIDIDGEKIAYREAGIENEKVLVLVHGFLGSSYDFSQIIPDLSKDYHVVATDLIPFGFSSKNTDILLSKENISEYLFKSLKEIGVDDFFLIGHSMGGEVAINLLLNHPEEVERLILIDSAGYNENNQSTPKNQYLASLYLKIGFQNYPLQNLLFNLAFYDTSVVSKEDFQGSYYLVYNLPSEALYKFNIDDDGGEIKEKIKNIKVPTLIIWGENDEIIPVEYAYKFNEDIEESELIIFSECGHIPYVEKREETLAAIYEFLK